MKPADSGPNASRCLCSDCPTYDECMSSADERLFCSRGATECAPASRGCLCAGRPVWSEHALHGLYFCTNGAAT